MSDPYPARKREANTALHNLCSQHGIKAFILNNLVGYKFSKGDKELVLDFYEYYLEKKEYDHPRWLYWCIEQLKKSDLCLS